MFIEKCFIRKNTEEIRNKLSKIGYLESAFYCGDLSNLCVNVLGNGEYDEANDYAPLLYNAIDCGDTEYLFLAIAALQTDTDKNQLFVLDENVKLSSENFKEAGSFVMCKRDTWNIDLHYDNINISINTLAHKATVPELVKHFIK